MQIDSSGSVASMIQAAKEGVKSQPPETVTGSSAPTITTTGPSDQVTLTETAAHMQRLEHVIAAQPVVNSQRVAQLQQVINDGGPKIDTSQLAAKILSFESALNSARSGA
jgi:negative regulator of flagellin synthesis FlgM